MIRAHAVDPNDISLATEIEIERGAFAGYNTNMVTLAAAVELSGELARMVAGEVTMEGEDSETGSDASESYKQLTNYD